MVNVKHKQYLIMKKDSIIKTIILGIFMFLFQYSVQAQECSKKNYCDEDLGEYDFRSQSQFGVAYPGDTILVKTAVYGKDKFKYNIAVCAHPHLENVEWKVVVPKRRIKKEFIKYITDTLKTQKIRAEHVNETDPDEIEYLIEQGEYYEYDADGNEVYSKIEVEIIDTIYKTIKYTEEVELYNNTQGQNFKHEFKRPTRVYIYMIVPEGDPEYADDGECYGIFIGRVPQHPKSKRTFNR